MYIHALGALIFKGLNPNYLNKFFSKKHNKKPHLHSKICIRLDYYGDI